ncbi:MAG TPA: VOC family protein [Acidimicrobiales bacterium]|nr:VOC family protein [Acidimicrobiales bacterium]
MSTTLGLSHVHLAVSDLERSVRFYVGAFGLEERYRAADGVVYLRIPGSADHVALRQDLDAARRANRFGFTLSDLREVDSLVRQVVSLGGSVLRYRPLAPDVVDLVVADPDGNVISL